MNGLSAEQIRQISEHVKPEDLPGDLAEAAEFIGVFKALLLGYHMTGFIYLKKWNDNTASWTKHHKLMVDIIGLDDAEIIVTNFCGTHFYIPKCDTFWRAWVHKMIIEADDKDQAELARLYDYSDRHIRRIIFQSRRKKNQMDLFGS